MIGFTNKKTAPVEKVVRDAINFSDTYHFIEPEQTTFRLRHAAAKLAKPTSLAEANLYSELVMRGYGLSSELRHKELDGYRYGRWLANHQLSLADAKLNLKAALRTPWKHHYDWLGQSLAHSDIMQNCHARQAYENLAILYRIQTHLLPIPSLNSETNSNGNQIEKVMITGPKIVSKANRLIDHYYRPSIIG